MTARTTSPMPPSVFGRFLTRCHTLVTRRRRPLSYDRCVIQCLLPWPAHSSVHRNSGTTKAPLEWNDDLADAKIEIPIRHYEESNRPHAGI